MKFYTAHKDEDGQPWHMQVFNVRKPNGRSHKVDGDAGDGESTTVCGLELTADFVAAESNQITCAGCSEGIRGSIRAASNNG